MSWAGRDVRSSADTVGRLPKDRLGYSLQGNAKTIEGKQHPTATPSSGIMQLTW